MKNSITVLCFILIITAMVAFMMCVGIHYLFLK